MGGEHQCHRVPWRADSDCVLEYRAFETRVSLGIVASANAIVCHDVPIPIAFLNAERSRHRSTLGIVASANAIVCHDVPIPIEFLNTERSRHRFPSEFRRRQCDRVPWRASILTIPETKVRLQDDNSVWPHIQRAGDDELVRYKLSSKLMEAALVERGLLDCNKYYCIT
jgi:hypothetical protein